MTAARRQSDSDHGVGLALSGLQKAFGAHVEDEGRRWDRIEENLQAINETLSWAFNGDAGKDGGAFGALKARVTAIEGERQDSRVYWRQKAFWVASAFLTVVIGAASSSLTYHFANTGHQADQDIAIARQTLLLTDLAAKVEQQGRTFQEQHVALLQQVSQMNADLQAHTRKEKR